MGLTFVATLIAAAAAAALLVVVSNVVAKPLGTVAAFAIGAVVIVSRKELAHDTKLPEWWLTALGAAVAVAVPLLLIAA